MNAIINDLRKINNEQRENIKEINNELKNFESNLILVNNNLNTMQEIFNKNNIIIDKIATIYKEFITNK